MKTFTIKAGKVKPSFEFPAAALNHTGLLATFEIPSQRLDNDRLHRLIGVSWGLSDSISLLCKEMKYADLGIGLELYLSVIQNNAQSETLLGRIRSDNVYTVELKRIDKHALANLTSSTETLRASLPLNNFSDVPFGKLLTPQLTEALETEFTINFSEVKFLVKKND